MFACVKLTRNFAFLLVCDVHLINAVMGGFGLVQLFGLSQCNFPPNRTPTHVINRSINAGLHIIVDDALMPIMFRRAAIDSSQLWPGNREDMARQCPVYRESESTNGLCCQFQWKQFLHTCPRCWSEVSVRCVTVQCVANIIIIMPCYDNHIRVC